ILTNGSTIHRKEIQDSLKKLDMVKVSLDAVSPDIFKKVNRPLEGIDIKDILKGIKEFRENYKGYLVVEVLLVRDVNDSLDEVKKIASFLKEVKPDRIDLGTVDRPPAYKVKPLTDTELFTLSHLFDKDKVNVVVRGKDNTEAKLSLKDDQILRTFKRRPFTPADIQAVFDRETVERINSLLKGGKLKEKKVGDTVFISPA
ncbi:MAG: radical SAM protein, partial [Aquificae bacterium]|nr:radical SAM protein [Aquificota bacterium]